MTSMCKYFFSDNSFIKKYPIFIVVLLFILMIVFSLFRVIFGIIYLSDDLNEIFSSLTQALPMDLSVSAYFSFLPAILGGIHGFISSKIIKKVMEIYFLILAIVLSGCYLLDLVLYGYWNFRLDTTPFFYFATSPSSAFASAGLWEIFGGVICWILVSAILWILLRWVEKRFWPLGKAKSRKRYIVVLESVIMIGLLTIAARGGVTVSTMNPSSVYKSEKEIVNHASLNPIFTLLYSVSHQDNFGTQYQYFDKGVLEDKLSPLKKMESAGNMDVRIDPEPDVYIIILESFSAHLFPTLGGENIATRLDTIMREGIYWKKFYASGFRTDRGIPAVLSGWPSAPSVSVMKYIRKAEKLPGIAAKLREAGYETIYYYGGDSNFTNMGAYLRATGFSRIVSDKDFPITERLSKWGAHDDVLLGLVSRELQEAGDRPQFKVIQTSSSHEPFDVPYSNSKFKDNPQANAFAFTDSVVGGFIRHLEKGSNKRPYLVVVVSDHWGCYPSAASLPDIFSRHQIPFFITGTALKDRKNEMEIIGCQTDIPAILLGMLGLSYRDFPFSHNLLGGEESEAVWMTDREEVGVISDTNNGVVDLTGGKVNGDYRLGEAAKGYLQLIYKSLEEL